MIPEAPIESKAANEDQKILNVSLRQLDNVNQSSIMDITKGDNKGMAGGMSNALIPVPEESYPGDNGFDQPTCRESSNCFYQKSSPTNKSVTSPSIVDANVLQNSTQ